MINNHFQPYRPPIPDMLKIPNEISPEKADAKDWMPQNQERRVANSFVLYQPVK